MALRALCKVARAGAGGGRCGSTARAAGDRARRGDQHRRHGDDSGGRGAGRLAPRAARRARRRARLWQHGWCGGQRSCRARRVDRAALYRPRRVCRRALPPRRGDGAGAARLWRARPAAPARAGGRRAGWCGRLAPPPYSRAPRANSARAAATCATGARGRSADCAHARAAGAQVLAVSGEALVPDEVPRPAPRAPRPTPRARAPRRVLTLVLAGRARQREEGGGACGLVVRRVGGGMPGGGAPREEGPFWEGARLALDPNASALPAAGAAYVALGRTTDRHSTVHLSAIAHAGAAAAADAAPPQPSLESTRALTAYLASVSVSAAGEPAPAAPPALAGGGPTARALWDILASAELESTWLAAWAARGGAPASPAASPAGLRARWRSLHYASASGVWRVFPGVALSGARAPAQLPLFRAGADSARFATGGCAGWAVVGPHQDPLEPLYTVHQDPLDGAAQRRVVSLARAVFLAGGHDPGAARTAGRAGRPVAVRPAWAPGVSAARLPHVLRAAGGAGRGLGGRRLHGRDARRAPALRGAEPLPPRGHHRRRRGGAGRLGSQRGPPQRRPIPRRGSAGARPARACCPGLRVAAGAGRPSARAAHKAHERRLRRAWRTRCWRRGSWRRASCAALAAPPTRGKCVPRFPRQTAGCRGAPAPRARRAPTRPSSAGGRWLWSLTMRAPRTARPFRSWREPRAQPARQRGAPRRAPRAWRVRPGATCC